MKEEARDEVSDSVWSHRRSARRPVRMGRWRKSGGTGEELTQDAWEAENPRTSETPRLD